MRAWSPRPRPPCSPGSSRGSRRPKRRAFQAIGGARSLFGVLCLHFPQLLTAPLLRSHYPVALLRGVLQTVLIASVILGMFNVARRRSKILGLTGIFLSVLAMALGGAAVPLPE